MPNKLTGASTKLERAVQKSINDNDDPKGFLEDVLQHGCQSGIVTELIYYRDTIKFYKKHHAEIDAMLNNICQETGETPAQLFKRSGWDNDDPLARDTTNQNILAWFGYEETSRNLANKNCIEG